MEISVMKSKITGYVDKLGKRQAGFTVKRCSACDLLELSDVVRRCVYRDIQGISYTYVPAKLLSMFHA